MTRSFPPCALYRIPASFSTSESSPVLLATLTPSGRAAGILLVRCCCFRREYISSACKRLGVWSTSQSRSGKFLSGIFHSHRQKCNYLRIRCWQEAVVPWKYLCSRETDRSCLLSAYLQCCRHFPGRKPDCLPRHYH